MNSLVKAMIKCKTNLISDTSTFINMVDDCLNYLVKAIIKFESNISIDNETFINKDEDSINYHRQGPDQWHEQHHH